ncbi:MAG: hypothetical protein M1819_004035 [Sarea resinae]|nr:MAG: hypothetical protein M1819_004035 [Sarea resinae]
MPLFKDKPKKTEMVELPPPAYGDTSQDNTNAANTVDLIDLTANLQNLDLRSASEKPTVPQCIAHLKLLESFYQLRDEVGRTDGLFGLSDSLAAAVTEDEREREAALAKIAEKRWAVYVARAADRFERWWHTSAPSTAAGNPRNYLVQREMNRNSYYDSLPLKGQRIKYTRDYLPPLDVLMVWHAYMLNPRCFLEDSLRSGKIDFWTTGMPWEIVTESIDNSSFEYQPGDAARQRYESKTGTAWDNLQDSPTMNVVCPKCKTNLKCPWTTCGETTVRKGDDLAASFASVGVGYADKEFRDRCSKCSFVISHAVLRVQKFKRDMQLLLVNDVPMPGTLLSLEGTPQSSPSTASKVAYTFPNRLLTAGLKSKILELADVNGPSASLMSVERIRDIIEDGIRDPSLVGMANQTFSSRRLLRTERIAIRKMMSRYWDNSSAFALDLVGAVIRQGSFIEKMHSIDWIHSPALTATMARLLVKNERFFLIMAQHPGHVCVPTLDVDLAWHTHQLSPQRYYTFTISKTGQFVDHDDKIEESKLSDAFEWTSKKYQKEFKEVYSECLCWYCEALRESHTSTLSRLVRHDPAEDFHAQHAKDDPNSLPPEKNVHISAHNAVKVESDSSRAARAANVVAQARAARLESAYQKACSRARKEGRQPPTRNNDYSTMAWGHPLYFGTMYAPYMFYPGITGGMYVGNPGCMTTGAGAPGNCAAGTCGAGVAAGGCAGNAGGCAGGAAGGCGGGLGGGGGCAGGGFGGGGGGGGCGGGGFGGGGGGCGGGGGGGGCGGGC